MPLFSTHSPALLLGTAWLGLWKLSEVTMLIQIKISEECLQYFVESQPERIEPELKGTKQYVTNKMTS